MRLVPLIIALLLAARPPSAETGIVERAVAFAPGASSATVEGTITGDQIVDYVLGARGGQTMAVAFAPDGEGADFNVIPPGSDPTALDGVEQVTEWSGRLPYDGDYRVRIFHYRGAADNGVTSAYSLTVAITGAPDPEAAAAPTFGPAEYDARGLTDCGEAGMETCEFKVLRYESGATFWIARPGGGERILYFGSGTWSIDSPEPVAATLDGDMWTIGIGSLVYRIAEVAIVGDAPF